MSNRILRFDHPRFCGLERVLRGLDAFGPQINVALGAMMRGMHKHIQDHRPPVRIGAALERRSMPGRLQLIRSDLGQRAEHIIKGQIQQSQSRTNSVMSRTEFGFEPWAAAPPARVNRRKNKPQLDGFKAASGTVRQILDARFLGE